MKPTRVELLDEFENAPLSTLFTQVTIAAVLCCGVANLERLRWLGDGISYIKMGRRCLYRKEDVLAYIDAQKHINFGSEVYVEEID